MKWRWPGSRRSCGENLKHVDVGWFGDPEVDWDNRKLLHFRREDVGPPLLCWDTTGALLTSDKRKMDWAFYTPTLVPIFTKLIWSSAKAESLALPFRGEKIIHWWMNQSRPISSGKGDPFMPSDINYTLKTYFTVCVKIHQIENKKRKLMEG